MIFRIIPLVVLLSCSAAKEKKPLENSSQNMNLLHHIWALQNMEEESLPTDIAQVPTLEIFVEEKKVLGNDGCNSISGAIKTLSDTELIFGNLISTKKACPNMAFSSRYNSVLNQVTKYKIEKLNLILFSIEGKELLRFRKVD